MLRLARHSRRPEDRCRVPSRPESDRWELAVGGLQVRGSGASGWSGAPDPVGLDRTKAFGHPEGWPKGDDAELVRCGIRVTAAW
jgi:hypothetical protein